MTNHPLTNWWNYEPVVVRCPCGTEMHVDHAQEHASGHWLRGENR